MVPAEDDVVLPDTAEVESQRERRRRFDEEWNNISEVLPTVPLEPMVVNVSTKLDEEVESGPVRPRTTTEIADEILEIVNGRFSFGSDARLTAAGFSFDFCCHIASVLYWWQLKYTFVLRSRFHTKRSTDE